MIMNEVDFIAFDALFRESCMKCFGHPLTEPLTETESRLLYTRIFDDTGLVIGWKSIKNYSLFVLSPSEAKAENPTVATLDTLSRYVMGAPYTTEIDRKKDAGHFPYWYEYRARRKGVKRGKWRWGVVVVVGMVLTIVVVGIFRGRAVAGFAERFGDVSADSLYSRGWWVQAPDNMYWKRRDEAPGCLTLFTMRGDNWPDSLNLPMIRNLLMRRIECDCWTAEVHLKDFIPAQNWQQAGILLMEDTGFTGRSMRISIAYNDYNGVYPRSGAILLQGIVSRGGGEDKPEEFAHIVLFPADSLRSRPTLTRDLAHTALRLEKRGDRFRILYADGIAENTSFKEISAHEFPFRPRYIGLFALRGYVDSAATLPARFTYFGLDCCTP